jgi:hypothetical protein
VLFLIGNFTAIHAQSNSLLDKTARNFANTPGQIDVELNTAKPGLTIQNKNETANSIIQILNDKGSKLELGTIASGIGLYGGKGEHFINGADSDLLFFTEAVEKMRIKVNGNVGIGTSDPSTKLDVVGDGLFERGMITNSLTRNLTIYGARNAGNNPFISLNFNNIDDDSNNTEYTAAKITSHNQDGANNGDLRFFTAANAALAQRMVIDKDGKIGINVAEPLTEIHIKQKNGFPDNTGGMTFEQSSGINKWKIYNGGSHLSFAQNSGSDNSTSARRAYIEGGTGKYVESSDARLKKNIVPIDENVLERVLRLEAKRYHFKNGQVGDRKAIGFIAQEVQTLFPELVHLAEDKTLGLAYAEFGILAIKAIQELNAKEMEQKQEIATLKAELAEIKQQNEKNQLLQSQLEVQQQQIDQLSTLVKQLLTDKVENPQGRIYELQLKKTPALQQNQPNPFHERTLVHYFVPNNAKNALIQVTNREGKILGKVNILEKGQGQIVIKAATYPAGTYFYSLIIDGKLCETKQMVLTK